MITHGIQTEDADIRIHVCPPGKVMYVFDPAGALQAIATGKYAARPAYQPGVVSPTAWGYAIPWRNIHTCWMFSPPAEDDAWGAFEGSAPSLADKGRLAVLVAQRYWRPKRAATVEEDIRGTDYIADFGGADVRIQIKCDWPASRTGNLYIQVEEDNPRRIH